MNEFLCGAASGVVQTLIGYPLDTYKILMQNNQFSLRRITIINPFLGVRYPMSSSIINCSMTFGINDNLKKNDEFDNLLSGFISGLSISPIVFYFDYLKISRQIQRKSPTIPLRDRKGFVTCALRESIAFSIYFKVYEILNERMGYNSYVSGGIAGLSNWTVTYPIDVVKTRQLINNLSIIESVKIGNLWKGYIPCAIRAITVNSIGFYVYDELKANMSR
jgi:solute carrier family 25 carnitine/acylcarnitine transporter 20/29